MKFSKELQDNIYEPWRLEYVAYDDIKQDVKNRQEEHTWNDSDEKDFEAALRLEADKVDFFINRKQREIESRIAYCERTLTQQNKNISPAVARNLYESTNDALTEILMDLNDLSKFTRYNFLALQNLTKKHDEYTKYNAQPVFLDIVRSKTFDKQRFDVLLVKISTLHDICLLHGKERTASTVASSNQSNLEHATAKYWIHPDNVTELKAILLFHLPVFVLDSTKAIESDDSAVSTVYLDNSQFDLYQEQLQRDEGAEAIRFRWYGGMNSPDIFAERKTHHAAWLNGASAKNRFRLDADKVDDFITGVYTAEQYAEDLKAKGISEEDVKASYFAASGIQKSIREKQLEPTMRIFYHRTVFQVPGDDRIRVSLDTDLAFVREDGLQERRKGSWRRPDMGINYPFDGINSAEVNKFPYAVLETRLQTHPGQEPPQWLTRLLDSKLVYEVPRFSKYLHGASLFWKPRLPLLPWWSSQMELDIRNSKQAVVRDGDFSGPSRSKSLKPLIDGKYRIGYLESQLERSSTLKRTESSTAKRNASLTRMLSTRSTRSTKMPRSVESDPVLADSHMLKRASTTGNAPRMSVSPFDSHRSSPLSLTDSNRNGNPFADPVWSQHLDQPYGSLSSAPSDVYLGSGSMTRNRTAVSDSRRTTDFIDSSSTEFLVGNKHTINEKQNDKMSEKTRLNAFFHEDIRALEEGGDDENYNDEKKKKKKKKDKEGGGGARIEPKVFFANERTFIHWLHFAAIILSAALTLLNFGDGINKIVGGVFFGISLIFALYSFGFYRWRANRITYKPHLRYDDIVGPVFLCILLIGALVLNFVLRFRTAAQSNNYLGVNSTATGSGSVSL
ncbi:MAG: VTC domain-containing protein [Benjaminiella poitrasii]|nr:MAG: VTC domain-containing protein [Benjaminiella poitrasii]